VLLIGSNLPHCWIGLKQSSGYAVQFLFESDHPLWKIAETASLRNLFENARRGVQLSGTAAVHVIEKIVAMSQQDALDRFASFLTVLNIIKNAPPRECKLLSKKAFSLSPSQAVYCGMEKTMNAILDRFQENLSLQELLQISGMSKATFARQFKKHTGKTFTRFLGEVRIDYACRELLNSEKPISEIAYSSGFSSLSHFNHSFQSLLNTTPRSYRQATSSNTDSSNVFRQKGQQKGQ